MRANNSPQQDMQATMHSVAELQEALANLINGCQQGQEKSGLENNYIQLILKFKAWADNIDNVASQELFRRYPRHPLVNLSSGNLYKYIDDFVIKNKDPYLTHYLAQWLIDSGGSYESPAYQDDALIKTIKLIQWIAVLLNKLNNHLHDLGTPILPQKKSLISVSITRLFRASPPTMEKINQEILNMALKVQERIGKYANHHLSVAPDASLPQHQPRMY
jgi:hypothetical protein